MRRGELIRLFAGTTVGRRKVVALLAGAGITLAGRTQAQLGQRVPVVGFLHPGTFNEADPDAVPFYRRMGAENCGLAPSGSIAGRMLPKLVKELRST